MGLVCVRVCVRVCRLVPRGRPSSLRRSCVFAHTDRRCFSIVLGHTMSCAPFPMDRSRDLAHFCTCHTSVSRSPAIVFCAFWGLQTTASHWGITSLSMPRYPCPVPCFPPAGPLASPAVMTVSAVSSTLACAPRCPP